MSLTNLLKNVGIGVALVSSLSCGTEISCNEGRRYVEGKGCVDDCKPNTHLENNVCVPDIKKYCWEKTFGDEDEEKIFSLHKAGNKFLAVGKKNGDYVIEFEPNGKVLSETFQSKGDYFTSITDSTFVGAKSGKGWILKKNNQFLWEKTFEEGWFEEIASNGENYFVAGKNLEERKGWVINIDKKGNSNWNKLYGNKHSSLSSIIHYKDNILTAGELDLGDTYSAWLLQLDNSGEVTWEKTYNKGKKSRIKSITKSNSTFGLAGAVKENDKYNFWLARTNEKGEILWEKSWGGEDDDEAQSIQKIKDGYIVAGYTTLETGWKDSWIIKVDNEGIKEWDKNYGRDETDITYSILPVNDGFIAAGYTQSTGSYNAWIFKIDLKGNGCD